MIYAIMSGEYSDVMVMAYAKTEEEAIKYCCLKNSHLKYEDYWYEEIDEIDTDGLDKVKLEKLFRLRMSINNFGEWEKFSADEYPIIKSDKNKKHCDFFKNNMWCDVNVYVPEDTSKEKAEKIALDFFYQCLYDELERQETEKKSASEYMDSMVEYFKKK